MPLWRSTDGGRSITDIATTAFGDGILDAVTSLGGTDLLAGFHHDDGDGWPDPRLSGGVALSTDQGASWSQQTTFNAISYFPGILYVGDDTVLAQGVVTGDDSLLVRSTDQGKNWTEAKPLIDGELFTCPEFVSHGGVRPECAELHDAFDAVEYALLHG